MEFQSSENMNQQGTGDKLVLIPPDSTEPREFQPATSAPPSYPPSAVFHTTSPFPQPPPNTYHFQQQQQWQPQQEQQVVVVSGTQQVALGGVQYVHSYIGHVVFACVVVWLFNCLFGLIAFVLAVMASDWAARDPPGARKLGHASVGMSITGIVVTAIIVIVVPAALLVGSSNTNSCKYNYEGTCYAYKTPLTKSGLCPNGEKSLTYCYSNSCPKYSYLGSCYKFRQKFSRSCSDGVLSPSGYCYYSCPHYDYNARCYIYKTYVGSSGKCSGVKSPTNFCYQNVCTYFAIDGSCYRYRQYYGRGHRCNNGKLSSLAGYCYMASCPYHEYKSVCYRDRTYVGDGICLWVKSFDGYCYHDAQ